MPAITIPRSLDVRILISLAALTSPALASAGDGAYATSISSTSDVLWSVPLSTEHASEIGPTGFTDVSGLAFRANGELYAVASAEDRLITIDPGTGAGSEVGALGFDAGIDGGLTFDGADRLWLVSGNDLYAVDPTTGAASLQAALDPSMEITGLTACAQSLIGLFRMDDESYGLGELDPATGTIELLGLHFPFSGSSGYPAPAGGLDFADLETAYSPRLFGSGIGVPPPFTDGTRLFGFEPLTGDVVSTHWTSYRAMRSFAIAPPMASCPRHVVEVPTLSAPLLIGLAIAIAAAGILLLVTRGGTGLRGDLRRSSPNPDNQQTPEL
ncbi:MAG: hypothetical protein GY719_13890 [bacterium]|nr:hypothetical protein [bacterium]